jgi:hypothetical protein
MSIETLGEAYRLSWRIRVRCLRGYIEGPKSFMKCATNAELDMQTLVWSKGTSFPLARLGSRLMCPVCGNREVAVLFQPPPTEIREAAPRFKSRWE